MRDHGIWQHYHKDYSEYSLGYTNIVKIIYKPVPDLFIAEWLSRQKHKEDKDEEIAGMKVNTISVETVTNIQECMMIHEIQHEMARQPFTTTERMHHKRMAREHRQYTTEPQAILPFEMTWW